MFDLTNVEVQDFKEVPDGDYNLRCVNAELKDTKSGSGKYISCELDIVGTDYNGRKFWFNFNMINPNEEAVRIGKQQLKTFMTIAKHKDPNKLESVTELIGLETGAHIGPRKSDKKKEIRYFIDKLDDLPNFDSNEDLPF